jgi:hypothetical protein
VNATYNEEDSVTLDPDNQPERAACLPIEERIDPVAIAQGIGEVTGGTGTLLLGVAKVKEVFGGPKESAPPPLPPPAAEE